MNVLYEYFTSVQLRQLQLDTTFASTAVERDGFLLHRSQLYHRRSLVVYDEILVLRTRAGRHPRETSQGIR